MHALLLLQLFGQNYMIRNEILPDQEGKSVLVDPAVGGEPLRLCYVLLKTVYVPLKPV